MAFFTYKGQTYDVPEGLSEEEAIQRVESYLQTQPEQQLTQAEQEYDPEEYEGFFQEVGEGIISGLIAIPQGIAELGTSLVDVVFDTDYTQSVTDFAESVRAAGGIDPTGAAGEIAEVFTQFAVPGLGAASAVSKARVLASAPTWVKGVAQVGAAGVTDAIVATNGTTTIGDFFEGGPTQTTDLIGLEGREKAMAAITNRLKLGFEAAGATALAGTAVKAIGAGTDYTVRKAAPYVSPVARQTLRAGTALSTKAREGLSNLFGEENLDSVLSVFRSRGNLSEDLFEARSKIRGAEEAELTAAASIKKQLDQGLDKIYKDTEEVMVNATPLTRAELNNRLYGYLTKDEAFVKEAADQGIKEIDMLPNFMKPLAQQMRGQVDRLSNKILQGGFLKGQGRDKAVDIVKQNIGSYLRRKYKIFEDSTFTKTKEFAEGRKQVIAAIQRSPDLARGLYSRTMGKDTPMPEDFIVGVGKDARVTPAAATEITDSFVTALTKTGASVQKGVTSRVAIDKLQTGLFKERTLSSTAFKRMLGEVKDPQQAYISTVSDLATFSATDDFLSYMASRAGSQGDLISEEAAARIPKNILDQNYQKLNDDYWGSAQGMFVSNRTYKDLTRLVLGDVGTMSKLGLATYSGFLRAKGITQFGKTVLSPITQVRNVTSASLFAMAQGNVGRGANLFESVSNVVGGIAKRPDSIEYYTKLQRLGVINTQSELREIDRLMKEGLGVTYQADETIAGVPIGKKAGSLFSNSRIGQLSKKGIQKATDAYQGGDDIWKIYNFEFEKGKLVSKFGSVAKAEEALSKSLDRAVSLDEYAADIVKNTVPNYERVPEFVKSLRKLPLGNFIAFPAEILRTSANTFSQALKELASEVPELQEIGMRRLTGLLGTTMVAPLALQQTAMALSGVDKEQLDAVRRNGPSWARNHTLLPTSTDEDGNLTGYVDYSYTNPYAYLTAPLQAVFNAVKDGRDLGKDVENIALDAGMGALAEMFEPFTGESIITEKLLDVTTRGGETQTGARVYRDVDQVGTKVYKSFAHIMDAFAPGALDLVAEIKPQTKETQMPGVEMGRTLRGILSPFMNVGTDPAGNERKAITEFFRAFTGVTETEVKPENIVMYSSFDYADNVSGARQIFNTSVRTKGPLNPADALDTYRSANEALYRTQSKMYQVVKDMQRLGMKDADIRRALKKYNIGDVGRLMRGEFAPMNISSDVIKSVRQNGNTLPMSELNDIKREYFNKPLSSAEPEPEPTVQDQPVTTTPVAPAVTTPAPAAVSQPTTPSVAPPPVSGVTGLPTGLPTNLPSLPVLGSNPIDAMKNMQIAQRTR